MKNAAPTRRTAAALAKDRACIAFNTRAERRWVLSWPATEHGPPQHPPTGSLRSVFSMHRSACASEVVSLSIANLCDLRPFVLTPTALRVRSCRLKLRALHNCPAEPATTSCSPPTPPACDLNGSDMCTRRKLLIDSKSATLLRATNPPHCPLAKRPHCPHKNRVRACDGYGDGGVVRSRKGSSLRHNRSPDKQPGTPHHDAHHLRHRSTPRNLCQYPRLVVSVRDLSLPRTCIGEGVECRVRQMGCLTQGRHRPVLVA